VYLLKSAPITAFRGWRLTCSTSVLDRCLLLSRTAGQSVQGQLLTHFGLRENAFGVTPDPRYLFLSQTHGEALASLVNGIDCDFGFQVLVAQPGMGKTTLLFNFLERFRTTAHTAFLFQPQPNPCELLQSVLFELGTNSEETSLRKLSEQLNQVLTQASRDRRRVIVVFDEAQNLDFSVLEALRQLSNFETASAKLMQIVLAGQPQLAKRLALPEQEQLMQRISSFGRLSPLALHETKAYIEHRLETAGYRGADLFTPGAIRNIWEQSRGIPRNINKLCFSAMLLAFAEQGKFIDERIAGDAARDLDLNSVLADLYQMEPSGALASGNGDAQPAAMHPIEVRPIEARPIEARPIQARPIEVRPITESKLPGSDSARTATTEPAAVPVTLSLLKDAGASASSIKVDPARQEQKIVATGNAIPQDKMPAAAPTLVAARATATPDVKTAAVINAPTSSNKLPQPTASKPVQSSPAPAGRGNRNTNQGKNSPPKTVVEPVRPERATAPVAAPLQKKNAGEKRSDSRIWWAKALSLTALTAVLAFALSEQFSSPRAGQVEANGAGGSAALGQGSAGSGDSAPSEGTTDTPEARPKNRSAASRNSSDADSNDDVTVRKFPTDADVASESSGGSQKLETIFFEQDSAMIGAQYGASLRRIAETLAKNPGTSAILEGHTDNSGEESYNLDLSSRRAIAVRNALVDEMQVSTTRLAAIGAGAASPVQPNSSAAGRAYNRRVVVRLTRLSD
jgi:type II secretory pathway predicted ATPase ExeA/outer membrane protein OmpA-like peptidoglycan-associated protein